MVQGIAKMDGFSAGEAGGIFAGVVVALGALGKGLAMLLNWHGERTDAKSAKLQRWEDSLVQREREYRETLEAKFKELEGSQSRIEGQNAALGITLLDVCTSLRAIDPANPALERARALLRAVFPVDLDLPHGLSELLTRLERKEAEDD